MYNPLQAERSWGDRITTTLSELRSCSICKSEYNDKSTKERTGKRNKTQTYDAFIAETRYFASHGVYCVDGIDGIDDTYNVYDWETRSIASLRNNIRQNINNNRKNKVSNEE
jgi:hypothetical protein